MAGRTESAVGGCTQDSRGLVVAQADIEYFGLPPFLQFLHLFAQGHQVLRMSVAGAKKPVECAFCDVCHSHERFRV